MYPIIPLCTVHMTELPSGEENSYSVHAMSSAQQADSLVYEMNHRPVYYQYHYATGLREQKSGVNALF